LTGGEVRDSRYFELLLNIGSDVVTRAIFTERSIDAATSR